MTAAVLTAVICGVVLAATGGASAAKIVGKDGVIYACYKAGGKHKGSVRLVAKQMHCRGSERKLKWSVRGPAGPSGTSGAAGTDGQTGATGETGKAGLESKVTELTTRVETLEATLKGVSNETLTKTVANVNALCTRATDLTDQVNDLGTAIGDISIKTLLAVVLEMPTLPSALPGFNCS